jgi:hypothetical protein
MSATVGAIGVVEAVREFLQDGTHAGADSPAVTFNGELAQIRTDYGLDPGTGSNGVPVPLPDCRAFDSWYAIGMYGAEYPRIGIVWAGHSGESEALNQARMTHRIELDIVIAANDVEPLAGSAFPEAEAHAKCIAYYDLALTRMLLRRSPRDEMGKDLNGGGTGTAQNRILLCRYEGISDVVVFGEEHAPLLAATANLTVRLEERP